MSLPVEYVKAELCRTFHCLPSELDNESTDVLRYARWLGVADKVRAQELARKHGTHR